MTPPDEANNADLEWSVSEPRSGIAALWARAKIADLSDRMRRGAAESDIRPVIVSTALKHHLVSKYTSLVAVDKTPTRPVNASLNSEQVPSLLPYGQSHQAIFGFPATATPAGIYRMNGVLLMLIAWLLFVYLKIWRSDDVPKKKD